MVLRSQINLWTHGPIGLFYERIELNFGAPRRVVSDRDTRITSKFWVEVCVYSLIRRRMSTAFHPQTDGHEILLLNYSISTTTLHRRTCKWSPSTCQDLVPTGPLTRYYGSKQKIHWIADYPTTMDAWWRHWQTLIIPISKYINNGTFRNILPRLFFDSQVLIFASLCIQSSSYGSW